MSDRTPYDVGLPKWPQMLVTGEPVTADQAFDIITATDSFFSWPGGNNKGHVDRVVKMIGRPSETRPDEPWRDYFERVDAWEAAWGVLETEYVHNSWVSCSYIFGPHGWCQPDGRICYNDNIGKWPSVEAVEADWKKIAERFPFVRAGVTLMTRERDQPGAEPAVCMRVADGKVETMMPGAVDVHAGHAAADIDRSDAAMIRRVSNLSTMREFGLDETWLRRWAERARALGLVP